jgi:3'-5' exonuclease
MTISPSDIMLITLDIETLPSEDPAVRAEIAATITPPGNMTKADTIAAWEAEKKPALVDQAILKTSFDGTYGRILCIGYAIDRADPITAIGDEKDVLTRFMDALLPYMPQSRLEQSAIFVGHNLAGFDLRFLWQRCVINGIKMPSTLLAACKAKAWDKAIADTMLMWNPERERRISLDKLCKALGVPTSKGDMDGSKVYETFKAGDLDKIVTYCAEDVKATRECYFRMMFA